MIEYKGTTYHSVSSAVKALKFTRSVYYDFLKEGYSPSECIEKALEKKRNKNISQPKRKAVTVNGKEFASISAAARWFHVQPYKIRELVKAQGGYNIRLPIKNK